MTKLHGNILFHVQLSVKSVELLKAQDPEPPNPQVLKQWSDEDFAREVQHVDAARCAYEQLLTGTFHPALRCVLNAERLNEMLTECGEYAVIRISLERPEKVEDKAA